jgi:hypothetical protein
VRDNRKSQRGFVFPPPLPGGYHPGMDRRPTKRAGPLYWLSRRSRRFWIVMAAMLPVLYLAGFGPACWLAELRSGWEQPVCVIYGRLIDHLQARDHTRLSLALTWWSGFGSRSGLPFWYWNAPWKSKVPIYENESDRPWW